MVAANSDNGVLHDFRARDFVGGHPVLDFVNTVTARNAIPIDWLDSYPTLLRWASLSDLPNLDRAVGIDAVEVGQLDGAAELRLCKELREALHAILASVINHNPVAQAAVEVLRMNWRQAAAHADLDFATAPFPRLRVRYDQDGPAVSAVRRELSAAAVDLLAELPGERLRQCPGERCGWLFLDTSKAGRRRWCDMATCGTAGKNRRRRPHRS